MMEAIEGSGWIHIVDLLLTADPARLTIITLILVIGVILWREWRTLQAHKLPFDEAWVRKVDAAANQIPLLMTRIVIAERELKETHEQAQGARRQFNAHMAASEDAMKQLVELDKRSSVGLAAIPLMQQDIADIKQGLNTLIAYQLNHHSGKAKTRNGDSDDE